jgi:hypothetical protein
VGGGKGDKDPVVSFRLPATIILGTKNATIGLFAVLAECPALREVSLEPTITSEAVQGLVRREIADPFPSVVACDFVISRGAVAALCALIPSVTRLRLYYNGGLDFEQQPDGVIEGVTSLLRLENLALTGVVNLTVDAATQFSALTHLRVVDFGEDDEADDSARYFDQYLVSKKLL